MRRWTLVVALSLATAVGCERERRVPYIAPTLHNWPQPYRGVSGLVLHVFETGTLRMREALVLRGGSLTQERTLPVMAYVLAHPKEGLVVFDTGLSHEHAEAAKGDATALTELAVEAETRAGQDLPSQMQSVGLSKGRVRWVILSNLRFQHAGELAAFPNARIVVSQAEHEYALDGTTGYVPRLFEGVAKWQLVDPTNGAPVGTLPAVLDLFGDRSCLLVDAPGPTPGGLALLVRLRSRPVLLAGDLAPLAESLRYVVAPRLLDDTDAWWDHIWRLKRFHELDPALVVVPGYDDEVLRAEKIPEVRWHAFTIPTPKSASETPTSGGRRRG